MIIIGGAIAGLAAIVVVAIGIFALSRPGQPQTNPAAIAANPPANALANPTLPPPQNATAPTVQQAANDHFAQMKAQQEEIRAAQDQVAKEMIAAAKAKTDEIRNARVAPKKGETSETTATASARVKLDMEELIKKVKPSVVRIITVDAKGGGVGSGFVVDNKGTVVTNVHVIAGVKKAQCEFANGTKVPIVGIYSHDQKRDIAIVKIDLPADQLTPVPLATQLPAEGAAVVAFGAPIGLKFTVSEGIVSALRPAAEMNDAFGVDYQGEWIQTSTPISPGNSGGPLLNLYGEVVAMNTMQLTVGQNLNFAVSAVDIAEAVAKAPSEFKPFTAEVIKPQSVARSRSTAADETGSERGRRLLADVTEIFLLNATNRQTLALDATGSIWDKIIAKSRGAVEKSKIELSVGKPSDDAAVMFVILEMKTSKKKTVTTGTQELFITAQVVCKDDSAERGQSSVCLIWKGEENLGTISISALQRGVFPAGSEEKLSAFFRKFRSACVKARQEKENAEKDKDKDKDK